MKYRKKPVVIEARKFTTSNGSEIATWCGGQYGAISKPSDHTDVFHYIHIPTLEGTMEGILGDYIIKGVRGEFYPCKGDIFEETYEAVDE